MKTIGRILIILALFSIVASLTVTIVNASGQNAPDFNGTRQFRPDGAPGGVRPERGDDRPGGSLWMFGVIKNIGVIAILVILIVWPKNLIKKRRKQSAANSTISKFN